MSVITVEVAYALADRQRVITVQLDRPATVADALRAAAAGGLVDEAAVADLDVGVYGKVVSRSRLLVEGDRVEIYRPLSHDPKQARKRRAEVMRRR